MLNNKIFKVVIENTIEDVISRPCNKGRRQLANRMRKAFRRYSKGVVVGMLARTNMHSFYLHVSSITNVSVGELASNKTLLTEVEFIDYVANLITYSIMDNISNKLLDDLLSMSFDIEYKGAIT